MAPVLEEKTELTDKIKSLEQELKNQKELLKEH